MKAAERETNVDVPVLATAYELLALSFRYPAPELVRAVVSGEWAEAACEVTSALGLDLPTDWDEGLAGYEDRNEEEVLHALRAEATRLFVGAPEPAASPYEGAWRAADDGVPALLFVNPHSMAVERFMKGCGAGRPEGTNEPLDRIDAELEFLQYLCMLEAGLAVPLAGIDAPEDGWSGARERFGLEHALAWMPRFADKVAAESREPFYRAAAVVLKAGTDLL